MVQLSSDSDYILGTHDDEVRRLEVQNRLWRRYTAAAWERGGIGKGGRVLDLGAGPGFAARDIARCVGPAGRVYAMERSESFIAYGQAYPESSESAHIEYIEGDIMEDELPEVELDAVWCRWVACFVPSPERLVEQIARRLTTGKTAVFHEFFSYDSWRFLGDYPHLNAFVDLVMKSWRMTGGEPNVGRSLAALLESYDLEVVHSQPYVFCITPEDEMWEWPTSFIHTNLKRLVDLGLAEPEFEEATLAEFRAVSSCPTSRMMTPVLIELISRKR